MVKNDLEVIVDLGQQTGGEAVLTHWVYDGGAFVGKGAMVGEAMLDKVTVAIEAPGDGYFYPVVSANEPFRSGQVIAKILAELPRGSAVSLGEGESDSPGSDSWVPAPPRVRRYAKEKNVDLAEVARGVVNRPLMASDIDEWLKRGEGIETYSPFRRQLIAKLTDPNALPTTLHRRVSRGPGQWPPLVQIAWATSRALVQHQRLNGWADSTGFTLANQIRMGIAATSTDGLRVPVITGATELLEWSEKLSQLQQAVRENDWRAWDFSRPSFVISNLGPWGIEYFTPRLVPPTVAILGIGSGDATSYPVSLTFDHRVLDGVDAAKFLVTLDDCLRPA